MPRKMKNQLPPMQYTDGKTLGDRIREARKQKGMSQKDLAELIGIQREHVTSYETGRLHLNDEMVVRFCRSLKVSSDSLLGITVAEKRTEFSLKIFERFKKLESLGPDKVKTALKLLDDFIEEELAKESSIPY